MYVATILCAAAPRCSQSRMVPCGGCGRTSFRAKSSGLRSRRCVRSSAAALLSAVASAVAPVSAESNGSAVLAHGSAAKPTVAQYSGAACYFGACNRLQTTPVSARACADLSRDRIRRAIRRTLRSRAIRAYVGRCRLSDALGMFARRRLTAGVSHSRRADYSNNQRPRRSVLRCALHYQLPHAAWCVVCCEQPTGSGLGALSRAWLWLVCGHASAGLLRLGIVFHLRHCAAVRAR